LQNGEQPLVFYNRVGLIHFAVSPPSIKTAIGQRPSTLAVELFYTVGAAAPAAIGGRRAGA